MVMLFTIPEQWAALFLDLAKSIYVRLGLTVYLWIGSFKSTT
jgi:hypothetical protein